MSKINLLLKFGMGDALNSRSFIIAYCKQKGINRQDVTIYTDRHKILFENDGFVIKNSNNNLKDLYRYPNFGSINIPKIYNDNIHWDKCLAINAKITYDFNTITPLNWTTESINHLDLPKRFITINYGYDNLIDPNWICAKTWPLDYWEQLVNKINIPCIQIGSGRNCKIIKGVKINLVNKLSLKQTSEVMKKALFHLDTEGGLTILNQHLGGKTVVLFGPTAIETYGRLKNLNISYNTCRNSPCEPRSIHNIPKQHSIYMRKDNTTCSLQCMKELKPDYVIEQIYKHKWL